MSDSRIDEASLESMSINEGKSEAEKEAKKAAKAAEKAAKEAEKAAKVVLDLSDLILE
jgi:hypothetical protein